MRWLVIASFVWCSLGQVSSKPAPKDLPAGWPPLPNFKQPVDYVKWLQGRLSVPAADDARPLYDDIWVRPGDSDQVKTAKGKMWGEDAKGNVPGLFTTMKTPPERCTWNPAAHPDWEAAYQAQVAAGLPAKLRAIAKRKSLSQPIEFYDPAKTSEATSGDKRSPDQKRDFGLTANDRLIELTQIPYIAAPRRAAEVILQNAWRAPQGKVDPDGLQEAIVAALAICDQASETLPYSHLICLQSRNQAYTSAIRALAEHVFNPQQTMNMYRLLKKHDLRDLMAIDYDAYDVARLFDILEFVYVPNPQGPPKPDKERLTRLHTYVKAIHENEDNAQLFDIVGWINRRDSQTAVRQIVELYLQIRKLAATETPKLAEVKVGELVRDFMDDLGTHILARQFVWNRGRIITLSARVEAKRRAAQLLYALQCNYDRTGKWPATLNDAPWLARTTRTDPFSGKDFCYRIQDGQPLLYSVAVNGKDDGGRHHWNWGEKYETGGPWVLKADFVFWPIPPVNP